MLSAFKGRRKILSVPLTDIGPGDINVRLFPRDLADLATSIQRVGVLQPILLQGWEPPFKLIAGSRRLAACRQLGLSSIPAVVMEAGHEASVLCSLIENLHREDINPIEEATAYERLRSSEMSQEEIARVAGVNSHRVSDILHLLDFPPVVQALLTSGKLPPYVAAEIWKHPEEEWVGLAQEAARGEWSWSKLKQKRGRSGYNAKEPRSRMVIRLLWRAKEALTAEDIETATAQIDEALALMGQRTPWKKDPQMPTAEEQAEMVRLARSGMTQTAIAEHTGRSRQCIRKVLKANGIHYRSGRRKGPVAA